MAVNSVENEEESYLNTEISNTKDKDGSFKAANSFLLKKNKVKYIYICINFFTFIHILYICYSISSSVQHTIN
jgi:hypothetical protein